MYPLLMLAIGTVLLVVLLRKVPLQIPLKQRMQAVCISSLLVLLTLLLSILYTWQIATLAFCGLFLLFVVVFSKQFEYEGPVEDSENHEQQYEVAPLAATTADESSIEDQPLSDELSVEALKVEEQIAEMIEENAFKSDLSQIKEHEEIAEVEKGEEALQPDNEEELLDYFQSRPKQMLGEEIEESSERSGVSRLRLEIEEDDDEVNEDLPVRIPPKVDWMEEDKGTEDQQSGKVHIREEQFEAPRASEDVEDVAAVRKRLFEELEIDDKKD
ncbi:hypothetical protein RYX56_10960 [Alkalihalophilus lindianensis]|uniref:Uncharacterized protein n=1 Tax=Alkalihalophilus lindianensis TaxID=1630542 RepID=A0ABU3XC37_9BACI|nr:hypothetical protein [Alkalihalophilus lindianensis]MDV2684888.1 hypothetical protein [Alkalihalophilus lindianensis]